MARLRDMDGFFEGRGRRKGKDDGRRREKGGIRDFFAVSAWRGREK